MRIVIVGAGPTGLFCAIALCARGHRVAVVDRDPGPPRNGGTWLRKGVMQFSHAHAFRRQVVEALRNEMPDVLDDLRAVGANVVPAPDGRAAALLCRRSTLERVLRDAAATRPALTLLTGHVDGIATARGRATGVSVNGHLIPADLIVDASGRSSRFTRGIRPAAQGEDCGAVYVTRLYQLREHDEPGPTNSPIGLSLSYPGYLAIAFRHDSGTFSVTVNHDGSEPRLRDLRVERSFEAAVKAIPQLAEWIDADRSFPITGVQPGGRLYNSYRGQLTTTGQPALTGLISVGDAVCTTTPLAGRGVALGLMQACELVRTLDKFEGDIETATVQFDGWCTANIKPWFDDHLSTDADRVRRWAGGDIDLRRPLPSDLIVAAAIADPTLSAIVDRYSTMDALPESLAAAEPRAREIYAGGWRPSVPAGPSRDELADICTTYVAEVA